MLAAVASTLRITKQKKSFKGACVYHGSLERQTFVCPVKALARRVTHIWVHTSDGTKLLCEYWDSVGRGDVIDRDTSFHMIFAAAKLGYPSRNIPLDRIWRWKYKKWEDDCRRQILSWNTYNSSYRGYLKVWQPKMIRIAIFTIMEGSENRTG